MKITGNKKSRSNPACLDKISSQLIIPFAQIITYQILENPNWSNYINISFN